MSFIASGRRTEDEGRNNRSSSVFGLSSLSNLAIHLAPWYVLSIIPWCNPCYGVGIQTIFNLHFFLVRVMYNLQSTIYNLQFQ